MSTLTNSFGQPIGPPIPGWTERPRPPRTPIEGRYVRIEPLEARHAPALFEANAADRDGRMWTYMPYGPFATIDDYGRWVATTGSGGDPFFHAIIDKASGKAQGVASLMRVDPRNGVIETGHIAYSPALQRTRAATESMYLLMRRVFDELGYRRYEWKCDALNEPSRRAAKRLGFVFEGVFRQAVVYKGRNRDTAWFAIIDKDWPALRAAYEAWLDPANFDPEGRQWRPLKVR
jgi:RimJ/RimL family protein N-acetyltransferase